jgi:hypothetical protein
MAVILVFIAFVIVGESIAVTISSLFERISETAGLIVFFALFTLVFCAAWRAAVFVTERYVLRQG